MRLTTALSNRIAEELGMPVSFDLEGRSTPVTRDLHGLARLLVTGNPAVTQLAYELRRDVERDGMRALQIDLDAVYDANPLQQAKNLDALIDRVKKIGPTHVFLQAFADPDGNGSADALYFPNRHLPMRADLFNRVAWQLKTRAGVKVYAWLPVLGYELKDPVDPQGAGHREPGKGRHLPARFHQPPGASGSSTTSTKTWRSTRTSKGCCSMTMRTCATPNWPTCRRKATTARAPRR
jgi:poly-beta-1,6-N-acetyl-D-glucosamine N-deacetylase PgaB